jgi:hypothetical protein
MDRPIPDLGRFTVSNKQADRGAFKTPTLRDVARRPPYMHDASARTLDEVIALYDRGGIPNPWLSSAVRPLGLDGRGAGCAGGLSRSADGRGVPRRDESASAPGVG